MAVRLGLGKRSAWKFRYTQNIPVGILEPGDLRAGRGKPNPYVAAESGYVDAVIQPSDTRPRIIAALEMLDGKRDKNSPQKARKIL
jgi:hypothetical protein